jgi:hypothetical protein
MEKKVILSILLMLCLVTTFVYANGNGFDEEDEIEIELDDDNGEDLQGRLESEIRKRVKIRQDGKEFKIETNLRIRETENQSGFNITLPDGIEKNIRIMPEQASIKAREMLKSRNIEIELKEKVHKNIPRVVYNIQANKSGRFLGIFKTKVRTEAEIDAETGELIEFKKPWWAFLVTGEDNEETSVLDVEEPEITPPPELPNESLNNNSS